jgi:hypothetical protein
MKEKLKKVLARHGKNQTNLASEVAQNLIAEDLHKEITSRTSTSDVGFLDEVRVWLNEGTHADGANPDCWVDDTLQKCLDHIEHLTDENESLWGMLDEIKAADIKNYSEEFREMMDLKLVEIKMLASMKPGQA